MSMFEHFDRGGQISMHRFRMRMQNIKVTLSISFLLASAFFVWRIYADVHPYAWQMMLEKAQAEIYLSMPYSENMVQRFKTQHGNYIERRSIEVSRDPLASKAQDVIVDHLIQKSWKSALIFLSMFCFILTFFIMRGKKKFKKKDKRGSSFLEPGELTKLLKKKKEASDLNLDGMPLIKNAETQHMLITGTTGAGKTNCFQTLLPQIRDRGDKALIIDFTGDYVSRYYREGKDILLNPFDKRSAKWDLWKELSEEYDYDTFAKACMPKQSFSHDSFWDTAGFRTLSAGLKKMAHCEKPDLIELYKILSRVDLKEFSKYFKGTEAAAFTDEDNEKTTLSVRATLSSHVEFLRHLNIKSKESFIFRDWIENDEDKRWVFLTCRADQRETLRPLFTAWLNLAVIRILSLNPDRKRRIWLTLDELPALQKVPALEVGLAEGRKYGLCFLGGFQSMAQLQTLYGNHGAETILDLLNTKVFFRSNDIKTQEWISRSLGRTEETKVSENISYGAHSMRDGVSLNESTRTNPLIMPEEVGALKNLISYIKLPGNWPITKKEMVFKNDPEKPAARFVKDPLQFLQEDNIIIAPKKKEKVEKKKGKKQDKNLEGIS